MLSTILVIGYILTYKITVYDIPAPRLSDSFSLNEKIEFIRKNNKSAEIIAIGSSICLNNMHSKTIVQRLHSDSYLNTSSWGTTMQDNYLLLKILCEIHTPNTLILASNITEFQLPSKKIDSSLLKNYLISSDFISNLYYLKCFDLRYYIDNFKYAKKVRSSKNDYEYLVFDEHGGVNLDGTNFKIDMKRWNTGFESGEIIDDNYLYLDSISSFCKSNNIELLFFQSPFRNGLYSSFDNSKLAALKLHVRKIESILETDQHVFIDSNMHLWGDTLFIDGEHLSSKGAESFTEYCFDKTDRIITR